MREGLFPQARVSYGGYTAKEKKYLFLPLLLLSLPRLSLPRPGYQKPLPGGRYLSLQSLNRLQCCHTTDPQLELSGRRAVLPPPHRAWHHHIPPTLVPFASKWDLDTVGPQAQKRAGLPPWASNHTNPSHPRLACLTQPSKRPVPKPQCQGHMGLDTFSVFDSGQVAPCVTLSVLL